MSSFLSFGHVAVMLGVLALLLVFLPLLKGVLRALLLLARSKNHKEGELARRQMDDAAPLDSVAGADGAAPSRAAELRTLASRS